MTMLDVKRFLGLDSPPPITYRDVRPEPRPPEKEAEIKAARLRLIQSTLKNERTSWEIRQELADQVLSIVSGD